MKKWGIPCTAVLVTVVLFVYTASLVHLSTISGEHLYNDPTLPPSASSAHALLFILFEPPSVVWVVSAWLTPGAGMGGSPGGSIQRHFL